MSDKVTLQKGNRVITQSKEHVKTYKAIGYDVIDENGNVVEAATGGKEISIAQHNKVVSENRDLREQLKKETNVGDLEAKNKQLTEELAEANKAILEKDEELEKARKFRDKVAAQKNNK